MSVRLTLLALVLGGVAASSAWAGQQSIAVCAGGTATCQVTSVTASQGVYFTVTTGGGNREYASVAVECAVAGSVVYSTVLTVVVPPKASGTSQTIYPPASSCVASLQKQMSIGKAQTLATASFSVT